MKTMKITMFIAIGLLILMPIFGCIGHYKLYKDFISYWSLADKSSTIEKKAEYIDKFVIALEKSDLKGSYNTLFFPTPDNSFDQNFDALKTLQGRLHEIQTMDIKSFEYQTAIQQITGQEQGEAEALISVIKGVWWKGYGVFLWDWVCLLSICSLISWIIFVLVTIVNED